MTDALPARSTSEFLVCSFDVDAYGYLSTARLAGYLQDAASRSADALGCGISELNRRGLTWVLCRQRWEIDEPIVLNEVLRVETWPSGIDRRAVLRDFRLLKQAREVGRVISSWFVLDASTRRPVRPTGILSPDLHAQTEHVMPVVVEAPPALVHADMQRQFDVRFSDIDVNQHVTNSSYVAWALEAIAESTWRTCFLAALDLQFAAECGLGAQVASRSCCLADGRLLHSIVRADDGKELARGVSRWVNRK